MSLGSVVVIRNGLLTHLEGERERLEAVLNAGLFSSVEARGPQRGHAAVEARVVKAQLAFATVDSQVVHDFT